MAGGRGGRKKGTPNRTTTTVKAALAEAFAELGGVPALVRWGKKHPTDFFRLWGRMLPTEVKAEHSGPAGGPIPTVDLTRLTDAELDALDAILARAEAGDPGPGDGGTGETPAG